MNRNGSVSEVKQVFSPVNSAHELWMRIRIVMCTICYCMLSVPNFLTWETTENLLEDLNDMIFHRLDSSRPDVRFHNRAYLLTMHQWSNQLRVSDCSLESLVLAKTNWSHFWTNYTPATGAAGSGSSQNDLSGLPDDLLERINQVTSITKALQSRMDKQQSSLKRNYDSQKSDGEGKGKGKNKDGKGKKKGPAWKRRKTNKNDGGKTKQ